MGFEATLRPLLSRVGALGLGLLLVLAPASGQSQADPAQPSVEARPPMVLSLSQARRMAVDSSPTLAKLAARRDEMKAMVDEVLAGGNPRLELQGRYTFLTPELGFATPGGTLPLVVNNNLQASLVLEQVIATFGRLHWGKQAAELQLAALEQEVARQRERIEYEVSVSYSSMQTARLQIGVAEASLAARQKFLSDLTLREQAGSSARFEMLVADVARAQDQQSLDLALQQAELAQSRLQVLLGLPSGQLLETEPLPVDLDSPLPPPVEAVELALTQRGELRAIDLAIEAAQAKIELEDSQDNPMLGLQTRYDQRTSTAFQTPNQWAVGVELRIPLYDGGLTGARVAQARAVQSQLAEGRREIERQVRLEVEEALLQCRTSQQNVVVGRANLASAHEAVRLGELRYQLGVGTHQEVLDVQARYREAQQGLFEGEQRVRESRWRLELALGRRDVPSERASSGCDSRRGEESTLCPVTLTTSSHE